MNIRWELEQAYSKICRATNPIDHMLIRRKFWKSNIESSVLLLKSAIKQLESLKKGVSKRCD